MVNLAEFICKLKVLTSSTLIPSIDESEYRERKRKRGFATHLYKEGWVEFKDKRVARLVARSLNNSDMGRKKRDKYAGYLWNLKYLKGFTWTQIHQKLSEEQEESYRQKSVSIFQANKQVKFLMKNYKKSKAKKSIQERLKKKGQVDSTLVIFSL